MVKHPHLILAMLTII